MLFWPRKVIVITDLLPTALEIGAEQIMNKISQRNVRVRMKPMLTRFSTEEMQRLRNASGGWLPPISMSVKNIPS